MINYVKKQYEYQIHSSINILFNRISNPGGLNEWFAEQVSISGKKMTFTWNDIPQEAIILQKTNNSHIRFKWTDYPDNTYFEFRIQVDDITGDIALIITDFVDEDDVDESDLLWDNSIEKLKHAIGS